MIQIRGVSDEKATQLIESAKKIISDQNNIELSQDQALNENETDNGKTETVSSDSKPLKPEESGNEDALPDVSASNDVASDND